MPPHACLRPHPPHSYLYTAYSSIHNPWSPPVESPHHHSGNPRHLRILFYSNISSHRTCSPPSTSWPVVSFPVRMPPSG
ncbi:hypothetical protein BDV59DRAFT_185748 [Aspergillus ambiguus]|uniref:uncharacterized protein n=1 Tax=Aspergillus ambiguus TaxID=176160 RepID=UPI003CCCF66F